MFKKLFSILIAVILCFTMLSGCSIGYVNDINDAIDKYEDTEEDYTDYSDEYEDEDENEDVVTQPQQTQTPSSSTESTTEQSQYKNVSNFVIEGKWKNIGEYTFGQAQKNAIVIFNGTNCNLYSPSDTYAFYKEGDDYLLDFTGLLGGSLSFKVKIVDENNIHIYNGSNILEMKRVG